ncbi:MAG: phosphatidate cytidylyltransferase [Thiotrichaceae bacterium]|nr:phosphatidate cytidylyltransferase [Thiotrichaceae bacterium]
MLKQRLITAIILIPIIIWVLLTLPTQAFAGVIGIFVVLGAWEWAGLCGWKMRMPYTIVLAMALYALWLQSHLMYIYIIYIACLWWLLALYWVWRYQKGDNLIPKSPFIKAILGFVILLPAWLALLILHEQYGGQSVLFLFVLIWAADSGAYFAGKRWGQRKLADKVSPGKTWEGVAGALLMSSIVSLAYLFLESMSFLFMLLCLFTVIVSILGDLFESLFKRQAGIKDSGQILPGHGGILDRIDSLTSAAPIFVMGLGNIL